MATKKTRIAVTLTDKTYQTFSRLAELQGRSKASVAAELMEEVAPMFESTVALLQAAKEAPEKTKERLLTAFAELERDIAKSMDTDLKREIFGKNH